MRGQLRQRDTDNASFRPVLPTSAESINPTDLLALVIVRISSLEAKIVTSADADLHSCKYSWNP